MTFFRSVVRTGAPAALLALAAVTDARDADACGGCFHAPEDTGGSIVTDHRMVFEITAQETILWDQIRYAGDPSQFAWVLPVRAGAKVELSRAEWVGALDAATHTTVKGPQVMCPAVVPLTAKASEMLYPKTSSSSSSGGTGAGCGGGGAGGSSYSNGSGNESAPTIGGSSGGDGTDGSVTPMFMGNDDVEVVSETSIGPYQAVTVRANGLTGIGDWLTANGFVIPKNIAPVVDAYTLLKFDFIALKLAPNQGVRAMQPIRITTPGADATMPLRMVAAGVAANVGITLWVIGEGRYHPANFPDGVVDWASLAWNVPAGSSNRTSLESAALLANGGRSWITEAAVRTSLTESKDGSGLPNVYDAYTSQCAFKPPRTVPCDEKALPPSDGKPGDVMPNDPDAGADPSDAGDDDAEASTDPDAGTTTTPACTKAVRGCDGWDDLEVATASIHPTDVWVTRLRANLPFSALSTDLTLEATTSQTELSPAHSTSTFNPPYDPCATIKAQNAANIAANDAATKVSRSSDDGCSCRTAPLKEGLGTWLVIGLTMIVLPYLSRQRRKRR